jgi:hypothetical protein
LDIDGSVVMVRELSFGWILGSVQPLLTVQFWELYCICNEKTKSLAEVWVNRELRLAFRRTFSSEMMLV